MEIPASFLILAVEILYATVLLFIIINLLHLFRFGLTGPAAPFVAFLTVALTAVIISHAWKIAHACCVEWGTAVSLPL